MEFLALLAAPFLGALALCAALSVGALCLSGAGARRILGSLGGLALAVWGFALLQAVFYQQAPRTELAAWRPASGFWRAVLGLIIWPYFLGVALAPKVLT